MEHAFHDACKPQEGDGYEGGCNQGDRKPLQKFRNFAGFEPFTHACEEHHRKHEAKARAKGIHNGLPKAVALIDVEQHHAQHGAVRRDQRQINAKGIVKRGQKFF